MQPAQSMSATVCVPPHSLLQLSATVCRSSEGHHTPHCESSRDKLAGFLANVPDARANLEARRPA
jgi:hypothetical protein